jgi:heme oxygenase (biliverdin-IX-beta and delta-forming)
VFAFDARARQALLTRFKMLPALNTLPRAFGCLYMFEPSTLGWGIFMRHLTRTLDITPEDGGAFFNSYGDRVLAMWRDFSHRLYAYASSPDIEESIIRAAIDTIIRIDQWMAGGPASIAQAHRIEDQVADKKAAPLNWRSFLRLL